SEAPGHPNSAVFSEADRQAKFVGLADEAFCIGPPPARESYLRGDVILNVAKKTGADAIHPGYGFLSENAAFSEACAAAGVAFVGPPAAAIRSMGDKSQAKAIMSAAGVPVVPGYHGVEQEQARLEAEAESVGFPLLVKAVSGGGGKGMKLATQRSELSDAIASARREAAASFGDDRLLLERYITRPRHVEVQVMADKHGSALYLFDRDCSVQRRHQKIIEEAPAPGLPAEFHMHLGEAAVRAAGAVGYESAGTVEFIVDVETQDFYFMEMNTRLQVEHPVTEAVTGLDLVELQLRVAAGEALPLSQADLLSAGPRGHSFEARLYAENTRRNFLPGGGRVLRWRTPATAQQFDHTAAVRVDSGVSEGDTVGTNYDPMIAKIVTHAADRESALQLLRQALAETQVAGLPTNLGFLQDLSAHPAFAADLDLDTGFIERHRASLLPVDEGVAPEVAALVGALWGKLTAAAASEGRSRRGGAMAAWDAADGKRLWHRLVRSLHVRLAEGEQQLELQVTHDGASSFEVQAASGQPPLSVQHLQLCGDEWTAEVAGQRLRGQALLHSHAGEQVLSLWLQGRCHEFRRAIPAWSKDANATASHGQLTSPMPGKVVKLLVSEGDEVAKGQPLLVIEAMKMEHTLSAHADGVVQGLSGLHVGTQVEDGQVLLCIGELAAVGGKDAEVGAAAAAGAAA
ncbi:carbamoyl-phosphate synthase L chain, ATP binding domain-containing protein, partial [Scenedesmus sp. NREL 46B-D3]